MNMLGSNCTITCYNSFPETLQKRHLARHKSVDHRFLYIILLQTIYTTILEEAFKYCRDS